jgi:hypothetical protein
MKKLLRPFMICTVLCLSIKLQCYSVPAEAQQLEGWPPLPQFDLNDNYTPEERKYVIEQEIPFYRFAERTPLPLPPNRLWRVSGLGEKAFDPLALPEGHKGRFIFAPGRANEQGERYAILHIIKVADQPIKVDGQMYYRASATPDRLYAPQLSPNGKTLLIREGTPPDQRFSGFNLFLWDMVSGNLRYIPVGPSDSREALGIELRDVLWSPGSRFVSYMRGGNTDGDYGVVYGDYDPVFDAFYLYVLDTPSRRDHLVMKDAGLNWSWTYHGQLLCSHIPREQAKAVWHRQSRPSVYVADATGGSPKKLFDGGYYAHESPDGGWIAFCDWPGKLIEAGNTDKELQNNKHKGLFLFNKTTGRRLFVGELALPEASYPVDAPLMQWSPDSKSLYVLEALAGATQGEVIGQIDRVVVEQKKLQPLTQIKMEPLRGPAYFRERGISPDGTTLYYEARQAIEGPRGYPNQQFTLIAVNTQSGNQTPLARLKNIANENPDWDWHDDSGINPAFAAAEKIEDALPVLREGEKDVDPAMNQPASAPAKR